MRLAGSESKPKLEGEAQLDLLQSAELKLAIELSIEKLQEFCAVLNEFALPRAIVDFERHSFLAWNPKFLEQTGFSEDEMKSSKSEELLISESLGFHSQKKTKDSRSNMWPASQGALSALTPRRDLSSDRMAKSAT